MVRLLASLAQALAAVALLLADPAVARTPKPPPSAAASQAAFKPYDEAMAEGRTADAADALITVLANASVSALHGEAWLKLASLLDGMELRGSALRAYEGALENNPGAAAPHLVEMLDLAEEISDEARLGSSLDGVLMIPDLETTSRSRSAYVTARKDFQASDFGDALSALKLVDKESPVFARAEALRGVILVQQGRVNEALAPFLTAQALAKRPPVEKSFENVLALNLARTHYAAGNLPRAIEYYAQVERGSAYWPEATFERAWAHFRLEDMNGVLGLLENQASSFLNETYLPEADLLRTYALFLLCKFPSAREGIDAFIARYAPVKEGIDRVLPTLTPQGAWDASREVAKGGSSDLPAMVLRPFASEERFLQAVRAVDAIDEELGRLQAFSGHAFATEARDWLTARRAEIITAEGSRIIEAIKTKREEVAALLVSVELTRIDMAQFTVELYEQAAATGKAREMGDRIGKLRKDKTPRNARTWPFEGEYWADELGYYRYNLRSDCPASM